MKKLKLLLSLFASAVACLGQQLDNPVEIPVWFDGAYTVGPGSPTLNLTLNGASASGGNIASTFTGASGYTSLKLNKTYNLSLSWDDILGYRLYARTIPGYDVIIDSLPASLTEPGQQLLPVPGSDVHTVTIVPSLTGEAVMCGEEVVKDFGKDKIIWGVSAGSRVNGNPAGVLMIRRSSFDSILYTIDAVEFYSSYGEIEEINISSIWKQIMTPNALINIARTGTNAFKIEFHDPDDVTWNSSGGYYSMSEDDTMVSYYFTKPATDQLLVRKNVDSDGNYYTLYKKVSSTDYRMELKTFTSVLQSHKKTYSGNVETYTIADDAGHTTIASKVINTFTTYSWGSELTQRKVLKDTDNQNLDFITNYYYYTSSSDGAGMRQVSSIAYPDGNWSWFTYHNAWSSRGQVYREFGPWTDITRPTTVPSTGSSNITYSQYSYEADPDKRDILSTQILKYVKEGTASRQVGNTIITNTDIDDSSTGNRKVLKRQIDAYPDGNASNKNTTVTYAYIDGGLYDNIPFAVEYPDDTMVAYGYDFSTTTTINTVMGYKNSSSGGSLYTGHNVVADIYAVNNKTTINSKTVDAKGRTTNEKLLVKYASGEAVLKEYAFTYNYQRLITQVRDLNNGSATLRKSGYTGRKLIWDEDEAGVRTEYTYNDLQQITQIKRPHPTSGFIYTYLTYDEAGRLKKEELGSSNKITTEYVYTLGGHLKSAKHYATTSNSILVEYDQNDGGRTLIETYPDGGTKTTKFHYNGLLDEVTGTAVVPSYNTYDFVSLGGYYKTEVKENSGSSGSSRWLKTRMDWLGRPYETRKNTSAGEYIEGNTYNASGQLTQTTRSELGDLLYQYDTTAELANFGVDEDGDSVLETNSKDSISHNETSYVLESGSWWKQTATTIYPTDNNTSTTLVSTIKERLTGLTSTKVAESKAVDVNGLVTTTWVEVNPLNDEREVFTDPPNQSNYHRKRFLAGFLVSESHELNTGLVDTAHPIVNYTYDSHGRLTNEAWDSWHGREYTYISGTDLVSQEKETGVSNYFNYIYNNMGRVSSKTNQDGDKVSYTYNLRGQLTEMYGALTTPTKYTYDSTYGDLKTIQTNNSNFTGSNNLPSGTWNSTTFTYYAQDGSLHKKTDALSYFTEFDYFKHGGVKNRQWDRYLSGTSTRVKTTYSYDDWGRLAGKTYNDSGTTDNITYAYHRHGALKTVTDGLGTRTFNYNTDLSLKEELLPADYGSGRKVVYNYGTGNNLGRYAGYSYWENTTEKMDVGYTFSSTTGRISSVATPAGTFSYTYASKSNRVSEVKLGGGATYKLTKTYLQSRNLLDVISVSNTSGVNTVARYEYDYNNNGSRATCHMQGDLFDPYGAYGIRTNYTYDDRNQLVGAITYQRTSSGGMTGLPLSGRDYSYSYTEAGNRDVATVDGLTPDTWNSNALNQIESRSEPNKISVAGFLDFTSYSAKVDGVTAQENHLYFHEFSSLTDSNATEAVWDSAQLQIIDGGSNPTSNIYDFIRQNHRDLGYDDDGNLLDDGKWEFTYDAENRVTRMVVLPYSEVGHLPNDEELLFTFRYDYLGRLVWIACYEDRSEGSDDRVYSYFLVYNGHQIIAAVYNTTMYRSYSWGLDMMDSLTAAGGVGALLAVENYNGHCYIPFYDGNGNVTGFLDYNANTIAAQFEYSPFGQMIREQYHSYTESAALSVLLPSWSTKFRIQDTDLYYYGYRFYDSRKGRFINRDPIGEAGGANLYAFAGNDPINSWDYLGMSPNRPPTEWEADGEYFESEYERDEYLAEKDAAYGAGWEGKYLISPPNDYMERWNNFDWTVTHTVRVQKVDGKPVQGLVTIGDIARGMKPLAMGFHRDDTEFIAEFGELMDESEYEEFADAFTRAVDQQILRVRRALQDANMPRRDPLLPGVDFRGNALGAFIFEHDSPEDKDFFIENYELQREIRPEMGDGKIINVFGNPIWPNQRELPFNRTVAALIIGTPPSISSQDVSGRNNLYYRNIVDNIGNKPVYIIPYNSETVYLYRNTDDSEPIPYYPFP